MSAQTIVVEQWAAHCFECGWHGDVYDNDEDSAFEGAIDHDKLYHAPPAL